MMLNVNHYIRLKQIAVFMPDVFNKKNEYERTNEPKEYIIPLSMKDEAKHLSESELMILDAVMTGKNDPGIYQEACLKSMQISEFEITFFEVCMKLYKKLQSIFFPPKIQKKKPQSWFFKLILKMGLLLFIIQFLVTDLFLMRLKRKHTGCSIQ